MEPITIGTRIHEFTQRQHDHVALTAAQLADLLVELNDLASDVRDLPAGDLQASTAKVDELRRQYTDWFNAAAKHENSPTEHETLPALEDEYCEIREEWLEAEPADRGALEAKIIDVLGRVEGKTDEQPSSDQLAARIRSFLIDEAGLSDF
ncbi:molybdopterin converting factor small subunit [Nakamurella sp. UYEF19]|uniref:hypothetical protein n=1 Tax=Nakamurella sp. UYEF19 TaxID=1756392 RepID=UPI003399AA2A